MPLRGLIKYKVHHFFFWMLVFGLWYFFRHEGYSKESTAFKVTLIKTIDLALMVYITNHVLIPFLLYKKKYFWFGLSFIGLILTSSIIKMNILGRVMNAPQLMTLSGNLKDRIYDNVIPHFFLVIAGAAIKLMIDHAKLQQRVAETAREKAEAELNFLKSQINPHFLFNSLNSVYFLIDKNNATARESLHKFSDMLRYQLYELNGDKIPIEKELRYLQDYVDLQKLRRDEKNSVSFSHTSAVSGFSIEPLLLIPFVENAFKHVSAHSDVANFIRIGLERSNGHFIFSAENSHEHIRTTNQHSGIGLQNVKRRLELLYPDKHELKITDKDDIYRVELRLKIDKHEAAT